MAWAETEQVGVERGRQDREHLWREHIRRGSSLGHRGNGQMDCGLCLCSRGVAGCSLLRMNRVSAGLESRQGFLTESLEGEPGNHNASLGSTRSWGAMTPSSAFGLDLPAAALSSLEPTPFLALCAPD